MRLVGILSLGRARGVRAFVPVVLLLACGGADDSSGAGGGRGYPAPSAGPGTPTVDCPARCAAKAAECNAPPPVSGEVCGQLCSPSITEDQLACVEAKR